MFFFSAFKLFGPLAVGFFQEAKERREELQRLRHGSGEAKRSEISIVLLGVLCRFGRYFAYVCIYL